MLLAALAVSLADCSDDPDKWYNKTVLENVQGRPTPQATAQAAPVAPAVPAPPGVPIVSDMPIAPPPPGAAAGPSYATAAPPPPAVNYPAANYPANNYPANSYPAARVPPPPSYQPPALPPQPAPVAAAAATGAPPDSELYRSEASCGVPPGTGAPPSLAATQSVGLSMTECEVARRIGAPDRVDLSASPQGARLLTLTYARGDHPHAYRFASGRLYSIEALPVLAPPRRTAR